MRTEPAKALAPATDFELPPAAEASAPPERRGLARDRVRLLVARRDGIEHRRFRDLPDLLAPGDLVVINTSATLPAALDAQRCSGRPSRVHVSSQLDDGSWVVEVRRRDGAGPDLTVARGERLALIGGLTLTVSAPYPDSDATLSRLWRARAGTPVSAAAYLHGHGEPIRYGHLAGRYPLADHQTVYANQPGSAEMASAGRPFTAPLLVRMLARGVTVAPVVLHAGVSSQELPEQPLPERFEVPAATARLVRSAREAGQRVIAVGTSVVRALETAAAEGATVRPSAGWTDLVLGPERPARVVDGLVTGLHAPGTSHLLLLEAVAGAPLVGAAYAAALERRYLWHEFGDSTLFLP